MTPLMVNEFVAELESWKDIIVEQYSLDLPDNSSGLNRAYLDVLVGLTNLTLALRNYAIEARRQQYFPGDDIKAEAIRVTEEVTS